MAAIKVGIIGGSGLSNPDILKERTEKQVETPFGKPSDVLLCGKIGDVECVLLSRHGRGHSIMPGHVNYRANIWALKEEGCTHILVTTACGSLQDGIHPGDIVVLDQFIDRTHHRQQTFYDRTEGGPKGICHMSMAEPFCPITSEFIYKTIQELNLNHELNCNAHKTGTMLTIEGPRFSSKAESKMWNSWGAHCINMTTVPEVVLAKEAGICYAAMGLVTDYDSWREDTASVSVESVMNTMAENSKKATRVLLNVIPKLKEFDWTQKLKHNQDVVNGSILLSHSY
ncbi:S-methyl-5'-thioadenosine phosphorylase-like isoform X3 [Dreissena polymorpha]|uniref:S-methyl-5'-thioadenosine phosphorylase n=1 Tax=Dreissena polymorpha TaxID=45954 RepID=A0A9D4IHI9_DREPO|nr:S-methyl-5'-thioadenosine phosphorylase-like isoform X1 [Dreissena polymorpha]XP_052229653.1 S-methyl-5'-thioadenosine phosphorylase-like isoform X2 [Dreissena polymorpha]XP_052229654.1 S-methyl-5'-thioadenosine phosphorylase-like isoform X3 [Dreissena polymorpha]XP_052229655.1 S-methyl-5'-thioadenosine phosphorylase-like isoform X3 [Dreissena polymorpha]XP_052229656.1 S-methyl-5'-thioadenosine phosphorylase-like isoform X3 [Dreissena polymorpha]XP_052229657.1 S-methyl-5'-thioadenosine phos